MKFGSREICDVIFKTTAAGQKVGKTVFQKAGMPAFMIDTAKTSTLEQQTTSVYATGGRGNNRLIAWEGEKQLTFTVEDALISPMGFAVLTGAGLINPTKDDVAHVHITVDKYVNGNGEAEVTLADLREETGLEMADVFNVCKAVEVPSYATVLDGSGAGIQFLPEVEVTGTDSLVATDTIEVKEGQPAIFKVTGGADKTVKLDFYLIMSQGVTEVEIKPEDFGGYFYVEAQTLYRREDTGKDMAAELILPKVKVQSGFTLSMASSGDPSTFTFTMDAFPGYTAFDKTKKRICVIQIIGTDELANNDTQTHEHTVEDDTPGNFYEIKATKARLNGEHQANQNAVTISQTETAGGYAITMKGKLANIAEYDSSNPEQGTHKWVGVIVDTGTKDITKVQYNGAYLTQADVDEVAQHLSAKDVPGKFILWVKCDEVATTTKTFTLDGEGMAKTTVTVDFVDVA